MCSPARASSTVRRRRSVATLLDGGHYLCSERTMYRILAADQPVRAAAQCSASIPSTPSPSWWPRRRNQTSVLGHHQAVGADSSADVLLPLPSCSTSSAGYAVGWMVADRENSALAGRLIEETCHKQGAPAPGAHPALRPRRLPMTSKCTAQLLADLGVIPFTEPPSGSPTTTPSREAQFKTLKYHPGFTWPLPRHHRRDRLLPNVLPLRTTPNIAMAGSPSSPQRRRASQSNPERAGAALGGPFKPPGPVIPNASFEGSHNQEPLPQAVWINPPVTPTTGETAQLSAIVTVSKSSDRPFRGEQPPAWSKDR